MNSIFNVVSHGVGLNRFEEDENLNHCIENKKKLLRDLKSIKNLEYVIQ